MCYFARMEWDDLRIFLAAVRAGSYSAAAPRLGINRTTVGRRVTVLEEARDAAAPAVLAASYAGSAH